MATLALPPRLWLPDAPLDAHVPSRSATPAGKGLALGGSLWAPFSTGGAVLGAALGGSASSSSTPRTRMSATAGEGARVRRRALWRGEGGLPDQPALVEWFPATQLPSEHAAAERVRGLCHAQLLRLLAIGAADARSGYAVSEASDGVDLATVSRAAPGDLPGWWAVHVIAQLCRAVQFLVDAQGRRGLVCRGHGRISESSVFVGWNGSVQLLAFAASAGPLRAEETMAPELRASDRFLSPAADVYALAVLLRQLLPAQVASRPAFGRLLRRALHPQADQRLALSAFARSLQSLLSDLQAPLARARAIGDVLGRYCPRASADLLETDWGESTGDGLAALPPSLAPLAEAPVSLSPTWYQRPASPKAQAQAPDRRRARTAVAVAAVLGVTIGCALWLGLRTNEPTLPGVAADPPTAADLTPAKTVIASRNAGAATSAFHPQAPAVEPGLQLSNPQTFGELRIDLRVDARGDWRTRQRSALPHALPRNAANDSANDSASILASTRSGNRPHSPESLLHVWVGLSNPGRAAQTVDLRQLRALTADGVRLQPLQGADGPSPAVVTVGAGRRVSRMLAFGPDVSDTAPASSAADPAMPRTPPPPNASTSR